MEAFWLEIILRVQNACIEDPAMKYLTWELENAFLAGYMTVMQKGRSGQVLLKSESV